LEFEAHHCRGLRVTLTFSLHRSMLRDSSRAGMLGMVEYKFSVRYIAVGPQSSLSFCCFDSLFVLEPPSPVF
jgi:hypothetical protein